MNYYVNKIDNCVNLYIDCLLAISYEKTNNF